METVPDAYTAGVLRGRSSSIVPAMPNWAATIGARCGLRGPCVSIVAARRDAPAFVLDHPQRDLAGVSMAAAEVAGRTGAALILPMYRQATFFEWARPSALVVNYVFAGNALFRRMAHERNVPVTVLDTEGAPYEGLETVVKAVTADPDFGRVAAYLVWSTRMRDAFRAGWQGDQPRFETTGHPRFDLLVEPLRSRVLPSPETSRAVVLVATSFQAINGFAGATPASLLLGYWRGMRRVDVELLDWLPLQAVRLLFALKAVRALATAYPAARIVVRPHPFEEHELYTTAFADFSNVEIDASGSASEAIARAQAFLHFRSNTVFEARALGVPSASLVPDRSPRTHPVHHVGPELDSVDQVLEFVGQALEGRAPQPEIDAADMEFAIGSYPGSSTRRVADAVLATARPVAYPPLWRVPRRSWVRTWLTVLRKHWVADAQEKRKYVDAAAVQPWLDVWTQAGGRPRLMARNVVGRPFLDPPIAVGAAPLAVEITSQT